MKKLVAFIISNWKVLIVAAFMTFVTYQLIRIDKIIRSIEWDVSSIQSDVNSIQSDISSIQSDVSSIKKRINY